LLDSLIIAKPLTIRGAGREKTSIVSAAPMCVLRFMGAGPWTLESLTCEHSGKNSASVVIVDSGQFTAKDCAFVGGFRSAPEKFGGYGLDILDVDSAILSQCRVERNESFGIRIQGKEDGQYILEECTIRECEPGVSWQRGKGRILKCTVEKCRDSGIRVTGAVVVEIQGCLVRGNAQHGIVFFHNTQGKVKNCQAHGNGHHGIAVYENAQVDTEGNTCTGNGQYGIEYFGDTKGLCRKNNCTLNLCGIGLGMNTTAVAEGNVCRQNKLDGIWIRESAQPVVRGNNCSVNGASGIRTQDVSKPTLSGNQCLGNKYWGINITDSAAPQVGRDNTLLGNGYGPISRLP
jgi:parallel beta-helix repeat protein